MPSFYPPQYTVFRPAPGWLDAHHAAAADEINKRLVVTRPIARKIAKRLKNTQPTLFRDLFVDTIALMVIAVRDFIRPAVFGMHFGQQFEISSNDEEESTEI